MSDWEAKVEYQRQGAMLRKVLSVSVDNTNATDTKRYAIFDLNELEKAALSRATAKERETNATAA